MTFLPRAKNNLKQELKSNKIIDNTFKKLDYNQFENFDLEMLNALSAISFDSKALNVFWGSDAKVVADYEKTRTITLPLVNIHKTAYSLGSTYKPKVISSKMTVEIEYYLNIRTLYEKDTHIILSNIFARLDSNVLPWKNTLMTSCKNLLDSSLNYLRTEVVLVYQASFNVY